MSEILYGDFRRQYLDYVAHKSGGQVLDLCCGPGWLALELGRLGQIVDAYDISNKAIVLAKRLLEENPYREGFGQVNYYIEDIARIQLGKEKYDAVSCWASWYYLADFEELLDRVWVTLKPGGIFAIEDDRSPRTFEQFMARAIRILLPTCDRTYLEKAMAIYRRIKDGTVTESVSIDRASPSAKTKDDLPEDTDEIFKGGFEVFMDVHFNAFSIETMRRLAGPDLFRYGVGHILAHLDRFLCRTNICKGRNRIIVACKKAAATVLA
ncbi:class I SAM-dependent methyltransferase [Acidobacteria bacterium AH-259-D05]|nr:class I SAM-dependent methyltransferase [Acidobacteria bacterium AH-259-D05]